MKAKFLALFLGFAIGLVGVASAQRTGGFPSRPLFQAVTLGTGTRAATGDLRINSGSIGIGVAPPSTNGAIHLSSNGSASNTAAISVASTTPVAYFTDSNSGANTSKYRVYADANAFHIDAHNDAETVALPILVGTNGGATLSNIALGPVGANAFTLDIASSRVALSSTAPRVLYNDTDAGVNEKMTECIASGNVFQCATRTDADGAGSIWMTVTRAGTAVSSVNLAGTAVTANGSTVWTAGNDGAGSGLDADTLDGISSAGFAQQTSGTFTASFDTACTTTPTITYDYVRVGDLVTLYPVAQTGFVCTSDSTQFATSLADVPAAIRPNTSVAGPIGDAFTNNGANVWAEVNITAAGNIAFHLCGTFGTATCNVTGWTASGNKGAELFRPITYMLGNP